MRKDVIIKINTVTSKIISNKTVAGIKTENLQGNLIIIPEPFVDGVGRLYINDIGSIEMKKQDNSYILPIKSSLLKNGDFNYCFKITELESEEGIPVFVSEISDMEVPDTIESKEEIPDEYPTWIESYDAKIAQINALEEQIEQAEQERTQAEEERNQKVDNAVADIKDLTEEYNQNAQDKTDTFNENAISKTTDFNNNATSKTNDFNDNVAEKKDDFDEDASIKKQELEDIAEVVRDLASSMQYASFRLVPQTGQVQIKQPSKMSNTRFRINNGNLEVKII